jgi:hypothetical protein
MFKLSKTQASTIQTLIYPQTQKIDRKFLDKNKNEIKKIQNENKTKKVEKENFIPSKILLIYLKYQMNLTNSRNLKMLNLN